MIAKESQKRVLFVGEAVTLAHVARPAAMLQNIDRTSTSAWLACDPSVHGLVGIDRTALLRLPSIGARLFTDRLRLGRPVFRTDELMAYVDADLALIKQVGPDLIVGDFRLSLSVSARLAGVPYASITNAYWSPFASDTSYPFPVLPFSRFVPIGLAQRIFGLIHPLALRPHCEPVNAMRERHGLATLGNDLRRVYTDADHVLYADPAGLFPLKNPPANHMAIGPLPWSPPVAPPTWWAELPTDRPVVYVTMGSSGRPTLLNPVVAALVDAGLFAVVSTAGAAINGLTSPHVRAAAYLPGELAAHRSKLVVCNGGSPTSQQAIAAGVPVLGICENMDQMLNMRGLQDAGLGRALRADRLTRRRVAAEVTALLQRRPTAPSPFAASLPLGQRVPALLKGLLAGAPAQRSQTESNGQPSRS